MELRIEKERYNPLLKRREVYFRVIFNGATPKRSEVREKLAALLNANLDTTVIDWMRNEFGKTEAVGYAKIYDTEEDMRSIEEEHILRRNFGGKEEGESEGEGGE